MWYKIKVQNLFLITNAVFLMLLFQISVDHAQNGNWTQKANMPTSRFNSSSCTLGDKIYVIGGDKSTSWSGPAIGTMEIYDPTFDSWDTTKASLSVKRVELSTCVVNGKIYAIGGAPNHSASPLGTVEEYDPLGDSWKIKASMPTPLKYFACGIIDNKIYVAGGSATSEHNGSTYLEVYDPQTNSWTTKAPIVNFMLLVDWLVLLG